MQPPAEPVAAHHTWLRRLARRIATSPASADDLVQDTCVAALQNAPEGDELRPWLRGVMRKLALGHWRTESRRTQREQIFHQHSPSSAEPHPLLRYGVDRQRLAEALETLPEQFRSVVVQRFIEGRTCAEIARDEKVPASTVRTWQMRALALLRTRLEEPARPGRPARRAQVLWLLPALGVERAVAAVGRGLMALSGQSKLFGLALMGLAVALGFHFLDEPRQDPSIRPDTAQSTAAGLQSSGASARRWSEMQRALRARDERLVTTALAHTPESGPSYLSSRFSSNDGRNGKRAGRRSRGHGIDDPAARLLEDCWRDERGDLRCLKPPMTPNIPGRPTCDFLNRNLAFINTTRSTQLMNISHANRFLTAALLTNMAIATNMGCQLYSGGMEPGGSSRGDETSNIDDPTCTTRLDLTEGVCTTCIDAAGGESTICGPADCHAEELPDGTICTTCADGAGTSLTICEEPLEENPEECWTNLWSNRLFCTYCLSEGELDVYCQPARCVLDAAGCLTCSDPDGHSETQCNAEFICTQGAFPNDDFFAHHQTCVKSDGSTQEVHLWPGTDTCEYSTPAGARCIDCTYESGAGSSICDTSENNPLPDPLAERTADLPAPGTCITETSPDGYRTCNTCAREDGETRRTCDYPVSETCIAYPLSDYSIWCVRCTYPDGAFTDACLTV